MRPPTFTPPYDSPIEEVFAYAIVKYLDADVDFHTQYPVETLCGRFRLDFVAEVGARKVGFECDGAEFHDEGHDEWRDAMILGDHKVDAIYRLRGTDIHRRLDDCLHLLARLEPELFSERGRMNLRTLATPRLREFEWDEAGKGPDVLMVSWPALPDEPSSRDELVRIFVRNRSAIAGVGREQFWLKLYRFAVAHGGGTLESVMHASRTTVGAF